MGQSVIGRIAVEIYRVSREYFWSFDADIREFQTWLLESMSGEVG